MLGGRLPLSAWQISPLSLTSPLRHAMSAIIEFSWTCCSCLPFLSLTLAQMRYSGSPFSLPLSYLTPTSSLGLGFIPRKLLTIPSCSVLCSVPSPSVHICTLSRLTLAFCICGLAVSLSVRLSLYLAEYMVFGLCSQGGCGFHCSIGSKLNVKATRKL